MKKFLSLLLTLCLLLGLSVTAFAETFEDATGSGDVGITANYTGATDNKDEILAGTSGKVYHLTLTWAQNGTITYNAGNTTYAWNQGELKYDSAVSGKGWTVSGANVKISAVNRSNRPVEIACANPVAAAGVTAINGSYDQATFTVASAATNGFDGVGAEQTASATYTISGITGDGWSGTGNIGTITVTIAGQ